MRGRLLAIPLLAALLPGCRTSFLNFDPESSAGALAGGWSGFERTPEGDTFVWAKAREARLSVEDRGDGDRLLRFRCWPFRWGGAAPQTLNLFLNDARIATLTLQDGPRVYSVPTPQAAWRRGANEIRLQFGYAEAPRDRVPGSGDSRTLAAAFDWLEIVPPPK